MHSKGNLLKAQYQKAPLEGQSLPGRARSTSGDLVPPTNAGTLAIFYFIRFRNTVTSIVLDACAREQSYAGSGGSGGPDISEAVQRLLMEL